MIIRNIYFKIVLIKLNSFNKNIRIILLKIKCINIKNYYKDTKFLISLRH